MTDVLTLTNIAKHFENHQVLKNVTFSVPAGQIVGYIGQNGAGKSTTLKIILGLEQASDGEVTILGQSLKDNRDALMQRIGYVPENADIFEALTANEYLSFIGQLYGLTESDARYKAQQLLTILGNGASFNKPISSFSKGMRQSVLIIASLLHNPELLFWDEPLNGLDANTVLIIEEVLAKLRDQGKTIFYSSHILDVVQAVSDQILLLNDGRVAAQGTFADLSHNSDTSLQQLFNDMTGFKEHGEKAQAIIDVLGVS
ncbi:MAG TPA: ABC transporter [Lactobacillus sp.]|nr:ABC transporter [Lactobacillus sp.]